MASTPASTGDTSEKAPPAALVYGFNHRGRVRDLIKALGRIPVAPSAIFRVDQFGKKVVVWDHVTRVEYYIRIRSWEPVVKFDWSNLPRMFGPRGMSQARKSVRDYLSAVRKPPMRVEY